MRCAAPVATTAVICLGLCLIPTGHAQGAPQSGGPPPVQLQRIPYKVESGPGVGLLMLRVTGGLVLMAALTFGAAVLARRYLPGVRGFSRDGATRIQLLESRRITPKLTLLLVEFEGERLLLAQSGERIAPLASHSGPDPAAQSRHGV